MKIPKINGTISRRLLLNYRISSDVVRAILPEKFRPKLVGGFAIGGICLIRLEEIRPKGLPKFLGISSENSAHRIAVEWEDDAGVLREGVYVPRRDTDSRLNALTGGRIFPGVQNLSRFTVSDEKGQISLQVNAKGMAEPLVDIEVSETDEFPVSSIFGSLDESSKFFEAGCMGYSSRPGSCILDGMKLHVTDWQVSPLNVHRIRSAYFDDRSLFPSSSIEFDHALLMRDIAHEWHSVPEMMAERTAL
jgi:hypothetical protein